jgi:hypothetical protein
MIRLPATGLRGMRGFSFVTLMRRTGVHPYPKSLSNSPQVPSIPLGMCEYRHAQSYHTSVSAKSHAGGGGSLGNNNFHELVNEYGNREPSPLTIRELMKTSQDSQKDEQAILESGQFIQKELPVRMARIVLDMQKLPYIVGINHYVKHVYMLYCRSFESLARFPSITSLQLETEYTALLEKLVDEHRDVIPTLSKGMNECAKYISTSAIKEFLDAKIHDRIGIRVLAEQHIALHSGSKAGYAGIINRNLSPKALILDVSRGVQVGSLSLFADLFVLVCFFGDGTLTPALLLGTLHS